MLVGGYDVFKDDIEQFVEVLEEEMGKNRVEVLRVEGEGHVQFLMDLSYGGEWNLFCVSCWLGQILREEMVLDV